MTLQATRTSPTRLTLTRRLSAPPARAFAAHTDPALLPRWCGGPEGWRMTRCEADARPGGALRYEWAPDGPGDAGGVGPDDEGAPGGFGLTGTFEAVEPPRGGGAGRTVHRERMHLPVAGGGRAATPEMRVETLFAPDGGGPGTLLTMTMTVGDAGAMDAVLASGMTDGVEASYARLDAMGEGA